MGICPGLTSQQVSANSIPINANPDERLSRNTRRRVTVRVVLWLKRIYSGSSWIEVGAHLCADFASSIAAAVCGHSLEAGSRLTGNAVWLATVMPNQESILLPRQQRARYKETLPRDRLGSQYRRLQQSIPIADAPNLARALHNVRRQSLSGRPAARECSLSLG